MTLENEINHPQNDETATHGNNGSFIASHENTEIVETVDDSNLVKESDENTVSEIKEHPTTSNKLHIIADVIIKSADNVSTLSKPTPHTSSNSISNYLELPEAPKRKNKREIERIPFAITSRAYQELFEAKRALKLEEEHKKLERKRKREASKANKENKKKCQATVIPNCFICKKNILKTMALSCDSCKNDFHRRCVPKVHAKHIPDEDDDDLFICHICYKEESEDEADEVKDNEEDVDDKKGNSNISKNIENAVNSKTYEYDEKEDLDLIDGEVDMKDDADDTEIDYLYNIYKSESTKDRYY